MSGRVNVCGMFYVSMRVVDEQNNPVTSIGSGTPGVRHVVDIENISSFSRSARVEAILPHGILRIAFRDGTAPADRWDQHVADIPPKQARQLECGVVRTSGPARSQEPIQCEKVYERRGAQRWVEKKTEKLPFQITIEVV